MQIGLVDGLQELTRQESVAVSTSSIVISPSRMTSPRRKVIVVRNTSPNATDIITISFGQNSAISNAGIILKQNESFTDAEDGAYLCYQDQINAICATATGTLSIFER